MNRNQSFKELKAKARKSLEGNYGHAISLLISMELIRLLPAYVIMPVFSESNLFNIIGSEIVNFILTAFLQILQVGVCFFYMKLQCNQPAKTTDLFYGFKLDRNTVLTVGLIFTSISFVTNLPALVISYTSANLYLAYCLLFGGIILNFLIVIPIRQSYYILLDFPDSDPKQAMLFSIKLMCGNYIRYIFLILSFFPLILISFLCCGIGLLWVLPYMDATLTAFYFDLISNHNKQ